ncbi:MAG: ABC transporter permease [Nitrospinota bacterium]|nr:ABC transporter permease [Nitrospinota bacterium]
MKGDRTEAAAFVESKDDPPEPHWRVRLLRSLGKQKSAQLGVTILALVVFAALFAPLISPMDPDGQSLTRVMKPPLWQGEGHLFVLGTDHLGRDLLSRLIYGARISLIVGLTATLMAGSLGLMLGLIAGYYGGKMDYIIMRLVDFVLSFPFILLALAAIGILGPSLWLIVILISLRQWTIYARIVRGNVLSLREQEYIIASRSIGGSNLRVITRHILPNVVAPVIIIGSLYLGRLIVIEAGLSFLGLGVPPPTPTWGGLLAEGRSYLYVSWWIVTFPGLAISFTVLGSNLVGDWLRDVLDPRLRTR